MNTSGKTFLACVGVAIITVGCGTPEPRTETVVTTTTRYPDGRYAESRYNDDGSTNGYRRLPNERLYEARVKSVRAIVGNAEERCWVERERVSGSNSSKVGGAIAGAVVGGILGHQIGRGRGQDVATAGGAIAGGAIGANVAGRSGATERDVKRCEVVANDAPEYYDVSYDFKGVTHHVQMTSHPGTTVTVNERGEPRV